MERSYRFPSNFASKQIIFIAHIEELYYKELDIPSPIPLITRGFSSHKQVKASKHAACFAFESYEFRNGPNFRNLCEVELLNRNAAHTA